MSFTLLWGDGWTRQESSLERNCGLEQWAHSCGKQLVSTKQHWAEWETLLLGWQYYTWFIDTLCCNDVCQWQRRNTWFSKQFIVIEITCFLWLLTTLPSAKHLEKALSIQIGSDTNYTGTKEMLKPAIPAWQNLSQTKLKIIFHWRHLTCFVCSSKIGSM